MTTLAGLGQNSSAVITTKERFSKPRQDASR